MKRKQTHSPKTGKGNTSRNFEKLKNLKFPCAVDVTVAMESTGKGLVPKLLDFQVKGAAPKA